MRTETYTCPASHKKCDNFGCVPHGKLCDFVDDCGDNSDEKNCFRGQCFQTEWRCSNEKCINAAFLCDGVNDCMDNSDEVNCESHLQCADGLYTSDNVICDGWIDCYHSGTDELNCGTCGHTQYTCNNTRCIERGNLCDGVCDCGEQCDDELSCDSICNSKSFQCQGSMIRCIGTEYVCDGINHCRDVTNGTDEEFCNSWKVDCTGICKWCYNVYSMYNVDNTFQDFAQLACKQFNYYPQMEEGTGCRDHSHQCSNGSCIPIFHLCDGKPDCKDRYDEMQCEDHICEDSKYRCANGQCIAISKRCDFHRDCWDGTDEKLCVPRVCEEHEFTCRSGQCSPLNHTCLQDNTVGCVDESHLWNCNNYTCPPGYIHCRNSVCVHESKICDELIDCPTYTDELLCEYACPRADPTCMCFDEEMRCESFSAQLIPYISQLEKRLTKYYLANNLIGLIFDNSSLYGHEHISVLDLSNNCIKEIQANTFLFMFRLQTLSLSDNNITYLHYGTFQGLSSLTSLSLTGNSISTIEAGAFLGMSQLSDLDLSNQKLMVLDKDSFQGLKTLSKLNLAYNHLMYIADGAFTGLNQLKYMDISSNARGLDVEQNVFNGLTDLNILYTDAYVFCCQASNVDKCFPKRDEFSSCQDLMSNEVLRICIWILGLLSLFGNTLVIVWRLYDTRDNRIHSFLISHLAIADMSMGLYLLVIAGVDYYYRGIYIKHDVMWRHSALCQIAGFLSTFSSELSVFTLTVITVDRFVTIIFPFKFHKLEMCTARIIMAATWLCCVFISALPLFGFEYFNNFYGRSGVCLALHITDDRPSGWEYSVFVFLVLNFVSFSVIVVAYIWMFSVARKTQAAARGEEVRTDRALARRMTLIVTTDFCCWMPIVLLGFSSLAGANVAPQVFAWVAVFVLPLNSAINPILYTISTTTFIKQARRKVFKLRVPSFIASIRTPGTSLTGDTVSTNNDQKRQFKNSSRHFQSSFGRSESVTNKTLNCSNMTEYDSRGLLRNTITKSDTEKIRNCIPSKASEGRSHKSSNQQESNSKLRNGKEVVVYTPLNKDAPIKLLVSEMEF